MDFTVSRTAKILEKALDGLSARHKAISANIANAQTDGYTRSDVVFEDQLQNIVAMENVKENIKLQNSRMPLTVNFSQADIILKSNSFENFSPDTVIDTDSPEIARGNNVNLEVEMVELSKNASRYNVLAQLEGKYFNSLLDQIKSASTL